MATSLLKESMMVLEQRASIDLPAHLTPGGLDHAATHSTSARVYVAHTANDALDGIDCAWERYLHSIANLAGMAGVLVSNEEPVVFTSNRGEVTVAMFTPHRCDALSNKAFRVSGDPNPSLPSNSGRVSSIVKVVVSHRRVP
jgi:hypothetical protein